MATNYIFAFGAKNNTSLSQHIVGLIRKAGPAGLGWWEIEANVALENKNQLGSRLALGLLTWVEPSILNCRLSGPLIPAANTLVDKNLRVGTANHNAVGFATLRKQVWLESNGENWLHLQIKPEINNFIAVMSVLDRRMKELPTFL